MMGVYLMTEQAIAKINTEMQKDPDNAYLEIIGHYIIDRCADEAVAAIVMAPGKSLSGAAAAVQSAARKKKKGNCGILKDAEVFDVVDVYFGFSFNNDARDESIRQVDGGSKPVPHVKKSVSGAINLDFENFF